MADIETIFIDETDSTNRFLHDYKGEEGRLMTVAWTDFQTAGRGQGKNSWESERGKNLTFSVKVRPVGLPALRQYALLEAGALAVKNALRHYINNVSIKWPNDIYWNDSKISGTLSECRIHAGMVISCVLGIGINVNQSRFVSDAPNPVSLLQATGKTTDRKTLLQLFANLFVEYLDTINNGRLDDIHSEYLASLYRRNGFHRYEDGDGEFEAEIETVEKGGRLQLRRRDGRKSGYAFKEVKFII